MRNLIVFMILCVGIISSIPAVTQAVEIWFEAEEADSITEPLKIYPEGTTDPMEARGGGEPSGGKYVGTDEGVGNSNSDPTTGIASYTFTAAGGTYKMVGRMSTPSGNSNSFWIQISGWSSPQINRTDNWVKWNAIERDSAWHWDEVHNNDMGNDVVHFTLSPGKHTLEIALRQDGAFIDCFVITDDLDLDQATLPDEVPKIDYSHASKPSPPDGAIDVPREVVLSWTPGVYAPPVNGHKVYLSENINDVNDGIGGITQDANSYAPPQRLDLGKTYYWRVDEANSTIGWYQGDLWHFTVEPVAYAVENITATASSSDVGREPENTVNGSGLDDSGLLHGIDGADNMWLSSITGPQPTWIEYEFDKVYKLHEMWIWNYNEFMEPVLGLGCKDVSIEYSVDGNDYTPLDTTHEFARGPGTPDYAHNTTIDFNGLTAKYLRLTVNNNWGGMLNQYGLSEVRFFYIPVRAREPSPDSGATDVDVDVVLGFRAGREAAQHDVYLSTDEQAVMDGNAPVNTVTDASYSPLPLDLGSTYYWRIDEVNEAETPTTSQGDVWDFTTQEYLVVEDFESYNDIPAGEEGSNLVHVVWKDGFDNPSANGSIIGYTEAFQPSMETSIVYDVQQSVPLFYDNTVAAYSEVTVNVADLQAGQDWAKHGIKALILHFYGDPNNSVNEQMYVKLNGSKVTYDGDADNLARTGWQMWYIDLASIGVSLSNVTELGIGFERIGAFGGQGVIYLDGIRLYSYDRQVITPAEAGTTGLQAHYEFEGTYSDSSGNARHGTAMGNPTFVAGKVGQAISLRGLNDFVEITGYKGILGSNAFSITAWIKTTYMGDDPQEIVYYGTYSDGQRCEFRVHTDGHIRMGNGAGQVVGLTAVTDGGWHHVTATINENATNSSSDVRIYVHGQNDTQESTDPDAFNLVADWDVTIGYRPSQNDRFFMGEIDDVRIYDRALSQEEIAWLAGRTRAFDKPF